LSHPVCYSAPEKDQNMNAETKPEPAAETYPAPAPLPFNSQLKTFNSVPPGRTEIFNLQFSILNPQFPSALCPSPPSHFQTIKRRFYPAHARNRCQKVPEGAKKCQTTEAIACPGLMRSDLAWNAQQSNIRVCFPIWPIGPMRKILRFVCARTAQSPRSSQETCTKKKPDCILARHLP
jgi:hypothetical protein